MNGPSFLPIFCRCNLDEEENMKMIICAEEKKFDCGVHLAIDAVAGNIFLFRDRILMELYELLSLECS